MPFVPVIPIEDRDRQIIASLRKKLRKSRNFGHNTCAASRHLQMIGEALASGKPYPMLQEEPLHCAITMLSVVNSLYEARTALEELLRARYVTMKQPRKGGAK